MVDKLRGISYNDHALRGINSVVECHLAKVKVASPNLVSRSRKPVAIPAFFLLAGRTDEG